MFCSCSGDYVNAAPNTHVCPVCLGMPGVLPVINKRAVELVIMTGLALHAEIAEFTKFDRKNYPYPDLMKGYQISQYDLPICRGGYLAIPVDGQEKTIRLDRVHLEEDVAKLTHHPAASGEGYSLVGGRRLEWEGKDTFTVPTWTFHEHVNSGDRPAFLFSYTDAPVMKALELYREEPAAGS